MAVLRDDPYKVAHLISAALASSVSRCIFNAHSWRKPLQVHFQDNASFPSAFTDTTSPFFNAVLERGFRVQMDMSQSDDQAFFQGNSPFGLR
jgi:hypothetical protein